jgi:hypothetical protein
MRLRLAVAGIRRDRAQSEYKPLAVFQIFSCFLVFKLYFLILQKSSCKKTAPLQVYEATFSPRALTKYFGNFEEGARGH